MIYNLFGFEVVQILPLLLVIPTLNVICYQWALELAYFVEHKGAVIKFDRDRGGREPTGV